MEFSFRVTEKNVSRMGSLRGNYTPVSLFFQEEEMPEVEIDIDDLLEVNSEDERAIKLQARAYIHTGGRPLDVFLSFEF